MNDDDRARQRQRSAWQAARAERLLGRGLTAAENRYRHVQPSRFRPRLEDIQSSGSGPDYHYRLSNDFYYSGELARELDRVDPIFGAALTRVVDNVVQDGFGLTAGTGVAELDDYLEPMWAGLAGDRERIDVTRRHNSAEQAGLALRSVLRDGDVFKMPHFAGRKWLEYHRCRTPDDRETRSRTVHGVELDADGAPKRFWFTERDLNEPTAAAQRLVPVEARNEHGITQCVQLYLPRRFSQNRGVSVSAPVADICGMLDDIQFAKLVQQQAVSGLALVHEYKEQIAPSVVGSVYNGPSAGQWKAVKGISAAMEYYAMPSETVKAFTSNVPNPEYFRQVMMLLGVVAVNVGIPVQMLLLDPSNTNFSGWRGAVDQTRIGLSRVQNWFASAHYGTEYRWAVQYWIATDIYLQDILTRHGFDWSDPWSPKHEWVYLHTFHPPAWRYIQPVEDITARRLDLASGFTSPRRQHAEYASDYWRVTDERIEDNAYAIEQAMQRSIQLNERYSAQGQTTTWRDLHEPVTAGNINISLQPGMASSGPVDTQSGVTSA